MKNESMKDKERWMDVLKEKLKDYSEPIPTSGWEQLEKELVPPKRVIFPYRRWIAVAAACALVAVSSVSIYFLNTPVADEIRKVTVPVIAFDPDVLPVSPESNGKDMKIESAKPIRLVVAQVKQDSEERQGFEPSVLSDDLPSEEKEVSTKGVNDQEETPISETTQTTQTETKPQDTRQVRKPSSRDKLQIPSERSSSSKKNWSVGAAVGNAGATSDNILKEGVHNSYTRRLNMAPSNTTDVNGLVSIPENQTVIFKDGIPYLQVMDEVVDIQHHQPISVGLTVRKGLKKGFSVETGIMYTLLSSEMKTVKNTGEIDQKLHYIGIPLRANWNFLNKNRFTLYVSAGGQIEKCVYGKLGNEKIKVNPLQFSVLGAVGAQFDITRRLGVYVEPGVAYFFDDGSDVQTIRKENPLNFNLQAGVRFTY